MKLLFNLCLGLTLYSCATKHQQPLTVKALPIDGQVESNLIVGPSVLNDPDRFVWGGSVVKGDDNKYHMLYSTWECGDSIPQFSDSWVLKSKIAYAVSDYPDRDFKFQKIILKGRVLEGDSTAWDAQMVHNPHLKKFNNKYYLYYGAGKDPGIQPAGSKGEALNKRNRVQQSQCIGVIEFDSFEDLMNGKYKRFDTPLLEARTRVKPDHIVNPSPEGTEPKPDNIIVVNPSVVQRPSDGKYLLYFKGNFYNPGWRGVHGVAIGDSPTGPFTPTDNFVFDIRNEDGTIASGEDPYVWYHNTRKKFYVVLKDFTGKITTGQPGLAILESIDGIKWTKPEQSFFLKKEVVLKSGDTLHVNRLERPQLLIDGKGNPKVLYAACALINVSPTQKGESFNVHIPLKVENK
ncbi:glycoside hydrolase family protein [Aestuariibaculum suncheonense]|uniref:Glycoside hydrolase family protein n=1 Tax=Aestuariibaculum suncheonense TaxID=1028745 RepID=A0A8J6UH03_9FLAO|nr:glycoside hydrolase family protein [Aestuariibaculum suncheonense]MBD0835484.1 glycoside hydrolase family protein [Aestuariibaculum suncheonense]